MPFTFKLSRRLALIYVAAALGAAVSGCDLSDIASTGPTFAVASIEISPSSLTLSVGESGQLTAIVRDARGVVVTDRGVTWASNDTLVARLEEAGVVTARAAGAAVVTATSEGKSRTASVSVPLPPVASVEVSPPTATVLVGATVQLTATPKDSGGTSLTGRAVTWATSAPAVATVSPGGLVTGVAAGSATITATSEGKSGTSGFTVTNEPVALVTVSPALTSIGVGATVQLSAVTKDSAGNTLTGRTVTWATSNSAVATVSASGLVTGVANGTATITAASEGQSGTAAITVTTPSCASSAGAWQNGSIPSQTGTFEVQFDATPNNANMDGVVGLSNGPAADWTNLAAVVRFNSAGTIDARNGGAYAAAAAIPYTAGTTYHFRLDVNLPSHTYDIYVTPAGATERLLGSGFAFRTEQAAVSLLNNLGLYADVGSETACSVAVSPWTPPPVASVTVSPASASILVGATVQLSAVAKDPAGNVLSGRTVTWTTSNSARAAVSATGLVTGLTVGAATITATSEGKTGSAAISVSVGTSTGKHYFVAPTGSDANSCSVSSPCFTMRRVSQLLAPGDTAHFAAGNYSWGSPQRVSVSGTASARVTYISDVPWGAKISGSCEIMHNYGDYVDIVGFDMTGTCAEGLQQDGNYGRIIGNRVHDLPGTNGYAGIHVDCCSYNLTGNQVLGNVVDNIGPWGGTNTIHGIYVSGPNSRIENNIVTRASAACIEMYHGPSRMVVSNNVAANCGRYGIEVSGDGAIRTNDYTTVDNNIVVNGGGRGIYESSGAATGPNNVYNNNIVYNNPGGNLILKTGTQSGTITLTSAQFSALFVNYTGDMNGDYHLQSGAVAIDAGTTSCAAGVSLCVPLIDFDGLPRPKGVAYDIGTYER